MLGKTKARPGVQLEMHPAAPLNPYPVAVIPLRNNGISLCRLIGNIGITFILRCAATGSISLKREPDRKHLLREAVFLSIELRVTGEFASLRSQ